MPEPCIGSLLKKNPNGVLVSLNINSIYNDYLYSWSKPFQQTVVLDAYILLQIFRVYTLYVLNGPQTVYRGLYSCLRYFRYSIVPVHYPIFLIF